MKKVAAWSAEDLSEWLSKEGMPEYLDALCHMDGPSLLRLTRTDFQKPPLSLVSSDGGLQLLERVETLRIENHMEAHKNGHANGHAGGLPNGTSKPQRNGTLGNRMEMVHIPIPTAEAKRCSFPAEWGKTGIAFLYALVCFVTTTVVISVVHERVPPKEHTPPLPDKFFDLFDRVEWAFSICEINGMLLVGLWLIQWILLKYRYSLVYSVKIFCSCWKCHIFFVFFFFFFQINYRQAVLFYCGHTLSVPVYYNVHHHSACSWDALQMLSKGTQTLYSLLL